MTEEKKKLNVSIDAESKPFWKSKTFYAAILMAVSGALMALGYPEYGEPLGLLAGALGFVGLRTATKRIG